MCTNEFLTGHNLLVAIGFVFIFLVVADALLRFLHGGTPDSKGEYYGDKMFPWKFLARLYFTFPEEDRGVDFKLFKAEEKKSRSFKNTLIPLLVPKENLMYLSEREGSKYFPPSSIDDIGFGFQEGWYLMHPSLELLQKLKLLSEWIGLSRSSVDNEVFKIDGC